jgi:hypothetical protein
MSAAAAKRGVALNSTRIVERFGLAADRNVRAPAAESSSGQGERTPLWPRLFQVKLCSMNRLTKQEQLVLCLILGLLLIGWAVKTYRAAHPPERATEQTKS